MEALVGMNSRVCLVVALASSVMFTGHAGALTDKVRVTGDRVSLRARADQNSETVCQVSTGQILLRAGEVTDAWVEVVPPAEADLWVYAELVQDSVAAAAKLRVRSGPGINYRHVGTLDKGDRVVPRGTRGDWLRIAPPEGCSVWISRQYVADAVPPKPPPKPVPEIPLAPQKTVAFAQRPVPPAGGIEPVAPSKPAVTARAPRREVPVPPDRKPSIPRALIGKKLVAGMEVGRKAQYEGTLRGSNWAWRSPSSFRLVRRDGQGNVITACYVLGNEPQLSSIVDHRLLIHGREYWLQSVRYPVIVPEQIIRKD